MLEGMRVRSLQPASPRPRRAAPLHLPPTGKRSATALAGFDGVGALGDFGDLAYSDSELRAWCEKNAAKEYGGRMDICLRCPGIHAFKRCAFPPPWTLAGKGARWAGVVLPAPSDYDFETMFVIGATNPAKLAVMSAVAGIVVPVIGAGVVQAFAFPLSIASALPLVLPVTAVRAKQRGEKFEERLWKVVLQPVVRQLGKYANALLDYALNGNSALARYAVREIAENLNVTVEAGILMAVAESTQIVDAIRKPALLREEGTLVSLGELVLKVADSEPFKSRGLGGPLRLVGETLTTTARPVSILLKKGPGATPEAFAALMKQTVGVTPESLGALTEEARRQVAKQAVEAQALPTKIVRALGSVVGDVSKALSRLPYGAGKAIQDVLASATALSSDSLKFLDDLDRIAKSPPPAPPTTAPTERPAPPAPPAAPPPLPAPAGPPPAFDVNRYYTLTAAHSGKVLDVPAASTASGAEVAQWAPGSGQHQQFRLIPDGTGHFGIVARHSGKALGFESASSARLLQLPPSGSDTQRFRFIPAGGGAYVIAVKASGRVLDVHAASTVDGAAVEQYDYHGRANQRFFVREVPLPAQAPAPAPAPAPPSAPPAQITPPTSASSDNPETQVTTQPAPRKPGPPLGAALAAGAAGALVFGPVGAAVGAGAVLLPGLIAASVLKRST